MDNSKVQLLVKMKKLISAGKRRFQIRKDRDYLQDLLELGISEEEAWNYILLLNINMLVVDTKPNFFKNGESLIFKRMINGIMAYIKLKIEKNEEEETVCLSFHKDR